MGELYSEEIYKRKCRIWNSEDSYYGTVRAQCLEVLHFQSEHCRSTKLGVPLRIRPSRTVSLRPGTIFFLGKVPTCNLLTKRNAMARYMLTSDSHCINYCSYGAGTSGYLVFLSHMFVFCYTPLFFFSPHAPFTSCAGARYKSLTLLSTCQIKNIISSLYIPQDVFLRCRYARVQ